jgi:IMP dehydrogenase
MKMKRALTYDDILLVPKYSEIETRNSIDLSTLVSRRYGILKPYVASCMDTVCEYRMAIKMVEFGGVGCIHRFMTVEEQCEQVGKVMEYITTNHMHENWGVMYDNWHAEIQDIPVMAAVGVSESDVSRAESLVKCGANIILIDVAHGHHKNVKNMIQKLREVLPERIDIIAGNISTEESAIDLCEWGADGLRVGIGGGSLCTTRIQTGHGVPNVTSIIDCVKGSKVPVMADGGIRSSGDIAKALSIGADCVMLGSLLAGTKESPGKIITKGDGLLCKKYRGSASLETKSSHGQSTKHVEGESTLIPYKGSVDIIIEKLTDGIKSALSYSGSNNIKNFHLKSETVEITPSGMAESKAHLL